MANVKTVSFGPDGTDLEAQQLELQRRQQMVDALRRSATTPQETQMVSGRAIPNKLGMLSQLAQIGASAYAQKNIDTRQNELGQLGAERAAAALRALAPPEAGFGAPGLPAGAPPDTSAGFTPPQQVDPSVRKRWAEILAANKVNPKLGEKLIEQEMTAPKWSTDPKYDQNGRGVLFNDKGQHKVIDGFTARDKMENVNGVWQNPYKQGENTFAPQDPNKPFGMGPNGIVPNQPYQDYTLRNAKAAAPNITTRTEIKAAESIAGQVGPILKDSSVAAQGAVQQMDAAQRVVQAVDSNKLFAGPGAGTRLKLAQIGDLLAINGQDTAEKIANTRQAIRGLAEMTLQGRKQMSGQGAITESESKLAERATSGSIEDMTAAELKQLANASARASQYIINDHNRKVSIAKNNPATSGIAGYFETTPMQAAPQEQQQPAKVRRYNPQTGRIE